MRMTVAFSLPRTAESVRVARVTIDRLFTTFGVQPDCRSEIALAVSEACANAVRHATAGSSFEVTAEADDSACIITVNDEGPGLLEAPAASMPPPAAEAGRGFALMRSTADRVDVRSRSNGGLSIRLFKQLRWQHDTFGRPPQ